MLKQEDNDLLTQVGPGTPMGDLFRRFWLPIIASSEIADADGAPVRLRVLGENLVGFRDTNSDVGIIDAHCPHRRALLFWGRNEECGLRCAYHGWKFDVSGQCVDIPSEPPHSNFIEKVKIKTYPVVERGGFVWIYMGPEDKRPPFPQYDWVNLPEDHRASRTDFQESNYLQALEGDLDTAHISYLHRWLDPDTAVDPSQFVQGYRHHVVKDVAPRLTVKKTDYGFVYGGRRDIGDGQYYWRLSHWLAPSAVMLPGTGLRSGRFLVPVDDEYAIAASVAWNPDTPLGPDDAAQRRPGRRGPFPLSDGYVIDAPRGALNRDNDYGIDREYQKITKFSGIAGSPVDEDRAVTETMGTVVDRSKEHLATSDVALIAMRRALLRLTRDLQKGHEPPMASREEVFDVRGYDVVTEHADFNHVLENWENEIKVRAASFGDSGGVVVSSQE